MSRVGLSISTHLLSGSFVFGLSMFSECRLLDPTRPNQTGCHPWILLMSSIQFGAFLFSYFMMISSSLTFSEAGKWVCSDRVGDPTPSLAAFRAWIPIPVFSHFAPIHLPSARQFSVWSCGQFPAITTARNIAGDWTSSMRVTRTVNILAVPKPDPNIFIFIRTFIFPKTDGQIFKNTCSKLGYLISVKWTDPSLAIWTRKSTDASQLCFYYQEHQARLFTVAPFGLIHGKREWEWESEQESKEMLRLD